MNRIVISGLLSFLLGVAASAQDSTIVFGHMQRDSTENTWHATLCGNDAGVWFCVWSMRSQRGAAVRGAFLSRGQREDIRLIDVSFPGTSEEDTRPAAAFLTDSTVLVAWQRNSGGKNVIKGCVLDRDGRAGPVFDISDDSAPGMMPAAGRNAAHEAVVVWQDYRNGDVDIYAQHYDVEARTLGSNVRINDDGMRAMQGQPRVAADNEKSFLLLWPDNRVDGAWKFYYQLFGGPAARNVLIDSAQRKAMTTIISGAWIAEDSVLFAWKDYREGHSNIYRRTAEISHDALSSAERINDDTGERWQRLASVDGNGHGNAVICWEDYRNTENNQRGDVYLQVFARDGARSGGNVKVNDRDDRIARKMPAIVMAADGWYLIVWHQGEEGAFNIVGQWLQYPDQREGGNFCLTCGTE
ncbi:MAG: hypothetical protein IH600_09890 [Bacteroidetes bacterium]|nr:hypothetical protein [Bacteroidota bacterium]